MKLVLTFPLDYINVLLSMLVCGITAISCFLKLNHMPNPRKCNRVENSLRVVVFFIGLGSLGLALSPFWDEQLYVEFIEVIYRSGVSIFSVWLTAPLWRWIPGLNRRDKRFPEHFTGQGEECKPVINRRCELGDDHVAAG